jgi:hypothetical protein
MSPQEEQQLSCLSGFTKFTTMLSYNDVPAHIFLPTIVLGHTKNSSLSGFIKFTTMVDIIPEDYSRVGIHKDHSYLDILIPSTLPIHSEIPAMAAKIYEYPSRIRITEGPFQLAITIPHSSMPASTAAYACLALPSLPRMHKTDSKPDLNNKGPAQEYLHLLRCKVRLLLPRCCHICAHFYRSSDKCYLSCYLPTSMLFQKATLM